MKPFKIAIVASEFNEHVMTPFLDGCVDQLKAQGITLAKEDITRVPGAVEIPLIAQRYAASGQYDAGIALGAVIRGETTHYDYVCQQASYGCQKVALKYDVPVVFGLLTTENDEQAFDRLGGKHGHKGRDYADTALAMARLPRL